MSETLTPETSTTAAPTAAARRLLLASFLSLYVELLLIRWIPSTLHIVAFFNNLVLIAFFLGLGVGMAKTVAVGRAVGRAFVRLAIGAVVLFALNLINPTILLGGDYAVNEDANATLLFLQLPLGVALSAVFALVVWMAAPLGSLVAAYFDGMERIRAYSINIAGSLLGVLAFSAIAYWHLSPLAWFAVGLFGLWLLDPRPIHMLPAAVVFAVLVAQTVITTDRFHSQLHWSPYYKVVASPLTESNPSLSPGFTIQVNDQFLLSGLDLRPAALAPADASDELRLIYQGLKSYYNFPFALKPAKRVLIFGSGAGNDVAAALRHQVGHVTAVEIDPVVLRLGTAHHPEKPYADPRVTIVNDDARAFLNRTNEKFDLIIFATLDAHSLLSSVGNVRLDSFIYTQESLASARDHLTDDGLLVLSFGPFREEVQYRQYATVRSVFGGQEPLYYLHEGIQHRTIVAGALEKVVLEKPPVDWQRIAKAEIDAKLTQYPDALTPATDDWPHLYIRTKRIPAEYLGFLIGVMLFAALLVGVNFRGAHSLDGHFFFLGAGFLLLETKSVTEFALLVGSTWQVNSLVFSVILLMILAANVLVLKLLPRVSLPMVYVLIGLALTAGYIWPVRSWAPASGWLTYLAAAAYLGVPIFLAALVFATTFKQAKLGSAALASNLLGAVLGGATEYLSIALGIRALSLLALAMYAASFLFWALRRRD